MSPLDLDAALLKLADHGALQCRGFELAGLRESGLVTREWNNGVPTWEPTSEGWKRLEELWYRQ